MITKQKKRLQAQLYNGIASQLSVADKLVDAMVEEHALTLAVALAETQDEIQRCKQEEKDIETYLNANYGMEHPQTKRRICLNA